MDFGAGFRPVSAKFEDIYGFLKEARATEPVFYAEQFHCWVLTRYDDIRGVLLDRDHFTTEGVLSGLNDDYGPKTSAVLADGVDWRKVKHTQNTDGKEHERNRMFLRSILYPARFRRMEPIVRDIVTNSIDNMIARGKRCEFVKEFAYPLPILTVFRVIGFNEKEEDMERLKLWSDQTFRMWLTPMSDDEQVVCARDAVSFQHCIREKMRDRRQTPRDDLMTEALRAVDSGESDLTDDELVLMFTLSLIGAGHGTTMAQLTSMMWQLLREPERWQYVLDHPEHIPDIAEEVIRYDPAALGWYRFVTKDYEVRGKTLKKGDMVFLAMGSGNRDEEKFSEPESFCPVRPNRVKALTFSQGQHFCPGADLARMELRIALEELSKRLPGIRLVPGQEIEYFPSLPTRGMNRLELEWD